MRTLTYNRNMHNSDPKEFTKTKLRYLYKRILLRIKEKPRGYFVFRKMRGACGIWEWGESIAIDPRKSIVPTIIHEVLHDLYPDNWEGWTSRVESKIINMLSSYDIYALLNEFFKKLDIGTKKDMLRKRKKVKTAKKK